MTYVSARVHGRPQRLEILCLDGFNDFRVGVNSLGNLQHGQPVFFAARSQARADAASFHCHGNQPGL
jgi:hypothetical protein